MPGNIGFSIRLGPTGIGVPMAARIPAGRRHIDPAAKCETVVDHDDLLMVRSPGWMVSVELGMDAGMAHPLCQGQHIGSAEERFQRAHIPAQQEYLEAGGALDEPMHECAHRRGLAFLQAIRSQRYARIEIPANQHDAVARLQHGRPRVPEIFVCIDDDTHLRRRSDAPQILRPHC